MVKEILCIQVIIASFLGGLNNSITGANQSATIGGQNNYNGGDNSIVWGNACTGTADNSLIGGRQVEINNASLDNVIALGQYVNATTTTGSGSFIFADGSSTNTVDLDVDNQFKARASNSMFAAGGTTSGTNGPQVQVGHSTSATVDVTAGSTGTIWSVATTTDKVYFFNNIQIYGRGATTGKIFAIKSTSAAENVSGTLAAYDAQAVAKFQADSGALENWNRCERYYIPSEGK